MTHNNNNIYVMNWNQFCVNHHNKAWSHIVQFSKVMNEKIIGFSWFQKVLEYLSVQRAGGKRVAMLSNTNNNGKILWEPEFLNNYWAAVNI